MSFAAGIIAQSKINTSGWRLVGRDRKVVISGDYRKVFSTRSGCRPNKAGFSVSFLLTRARIGAFGRPSTGSGSPGITKEGQLVQRYAVFLRCVATLVRVRFRRGELSETTVSAAGSWAAISASTSRSAASQCRSAWPCTRPAAFQSWYARSRMR
jgi:hypothetical protein